MPDEIKIKSEGHGKNTFIEVNGQKIERVKKIEFGATVNDLNEVTVTYVGSDITVDLEITGPEFLKAILKERTFYNIKLPIPPNPDDIMISSFLIVNGEAGVTSSIFDKSLLTIHKTKLKEIMGDINTQAAIVLDGINFPKGSNKDRYARTYRLKPDDEAPEHLIYAGEDELPFTTFVEKEMSSRPSDQYFATTAKRLNKVYDDLKENNDNIDNRGIITETIMMELKNIIDQMSVEKPLTHEALEDAQKGFKNAGANPYE